MPVQSRRCYANRARGPPGGGGGPPHPFRAVGPSPERPAQGGARGRAACGLEAGELRRLRALSSRDDDERRELASSRRDGRRLARRGPRQSLARRSQEHDSASHHALARAACAPSSQGAAESDGPTRPMCSAYRGSSDRPPGWVSGDGSPLPGSPPRLRGRPPPLRGRPSSVSRETPRGRARPPPGQPPGPTPVSADPLPVGSRELGPPPRGPPWGPGKDGRGRGRFAVVFRRGSPGRATNRDGARPDPVQRRGAWRSSSAPARLPRTRERRSTPRHPQRHTGARGEEVGASSGDRPPPIHAA
jgi:hypothetical protein